VSGWHEARFLSRGFLAPVARGAPVDASPERNHGCEQLEGGPNPRVSGGDGDGDGPAENLICGRGVSRRSGRGSLYLRDRGNLAHRASESGPVPAWINSGVLELVQLFCEGRPSNRSRRWRAAAPELAAASRANRRSPEGGGPPLFYSRRGTSGGLGVAGCAECPPTFCTPPELVSRRARRWSSGPCCAISEGLEDRFEAGANDL